MIDTAKIVPVLQFLIIISDFKHVCEKTNAEYKEWKNNIKHLRNVTYIAASQVVT